MLISAVRFLVGYCSRHAWLVLAAAALVTIASGYYAARNFAITTDTNTLISPSLDWRQRELAFDKDFPGSQNSILVVVDAPTPELASEASALLADNLAKNTTLFRSVKRPDGDPFLARSALLFQSEAELTQTAEGLGRAGPIIGALANDPSLRGLTRAFSFALLGVQQGQATLAQLQRAMTMATATIDDALAGRPATFSWQELLTGKPATAGERRKFVDVEPVLDFSALEPGRVGSEAIRQAVDDLKLATDYGAQVRLTGAVAMADDEFATLQEGALVNVIVTVVLVLLILWLALHSPRIIVAVALNLVVGFAATAALGLMMVGALNLISVAFAVLFVGLGVDFGIQFAVRYRSERHKHGDMMSALLSSADKIGAPLTLAAAAVAAGFLSFFPTDYRGVSELGQIAGVGMLLAFLTSVTVLPALLTVLQPPGEEEAIGYRVLAPVDRFLEKHRIPVIAGTFGVAVLGLPLLYHLRFDFNPLNLRSAEVESVATFLELRTDPTLGANAINVVARRSDDAAKIAADLRALPEVDRTMTLQDLVPQDQDKKLALIRGLAGRLETSLGGANSPPPSDAQTVAALQSTANSLRRLAGSGNDPGADAARKLIASLDNLAAADKAKRDAAEIAFVRPLRTSLAGLRTSLQAQPVTLETVPEGLRRQWIAADGRQRIQALPKGDPNDNETLRAFARAIQAKHPDAVGAPISILESGKTIVRAFIVAGALAFLSIGILLWIVLRRFGDVLLTLLPLAVAGLITLEATVLIGMPMNFANIIALPLLLGVGVAFKIYYIMAWRAGQTNLLQSSLTRAVIWSALTTATAFGSLWLSSHPGTSSMGKLLALSLLCTMCAAVLFQPALMGKPRTAEENGAVDEPAATTEPAVEEAAAKPSG